MPHAKTDPTNGLITAPDLDPRARRSSWLARGVAAFGEGRWARLLAVALVPLLLWDRWDLDTFSASWLFPTLAVYVLATGLLPRRRLLQGADLLVAAAIILVTGVAVAPYLPFILVAVAGPASSEGLWAGLAAGGVLGSLLLVSLAYAETPPALGFAGMLATILLPPLAGVTAAAAGEVIETRNLRDRRILQEANRLLSSLQAIADEVPGGLDVSTVAANVMREVQQMPGVQAALLLNEDGAAFRQVGRVGRILDLPDQRVDIPSELAQGDGRLVTASELDGALRTACEDVPHWLLLPIGSTAAPTAWLMVGFDDPAHATRLRSALAPLTTDVSLALDNARLFDGTRSRAIDAARRQVAADLHDGVAQSLAHLRMELDLLALQPGSHQPELQRLSSVTEAALLDLRRTISGLRIAREDALAARLEQHLRQVRTPHGARLDLIVLDDPPLTATMIEEMFRIAHEAVSNALRHAQANEITVILDHDDDQVILRVEDDGRGWVPEELDETSGVGLGSMRERAQRLQGTIEFTSTERGGALVCLRVPSRTAASTAVKPS